MSLIASSSPSPFQHTREKPFQCSVCGKAFAHRESLVTHSSVHTGILPYGCLNCSKRFSCIGNLIKHRKTRQDSCGLPQFCKNVKLAPRPNTKIPGSLLMTPLRKKYTPRNKRGGGRERGEAATTVVVDSSSSGLEGVKRRSTRRVKEKLEEMGGGGGDQGVEEEEDDDEGQQGEEHVPEDGYMVLELGLNDQETAVEMNLVPDVEGQAQGEGEEEQSSVNDSQNPIIFSVVGADQQQQQHEPQHHQPSPLVVTDLEGHQIIGGNYIIDMNVAAMNVQEIEEGQEVVVQHEEEEQEEEEGKKRPRRQPKAPVITEAHEEPGESVVFVCNICYARFEEEGAAVQHQEEAHAEEVAEEPEGKKTKKRGSGGGGGVGVVGSATRHECLKCLKSFALAKSLQKHEESDCGRLVEHICEVCHKGYASAATLKTHMSCHNGERPFRCCECGKRFRTQIQLNVHSRVHTGDKPYKCEHCPRSFAHRETLMTHQSIHTGYKRFLCIYCGGRFSCISNLQSHRRARKTTCGAHPAHTRPVGENEDVTQLMIEKEEGAVVV